MMSPAPAAAAATTAAAAAATTAAAAAAATATTAALRTVQGRVEAPHIPAPADILKRHASAGTAVVARSEGGHAGVGLVLHVAVGGARRPRVEAFLPRPAAVAEGWVGVGKEGLGRFVWGRLDGVGLIAGVDGADAHETQALQRREKGADRG